MLPYFLIQDSLHIKFISLKETTINSSNQSTIRSNTPKLISRFLNIKYHKVKPSLDSRRQCLP